MFTGRVWIGDEGTIITVTKGTKAGPPGSETASVIDVGSSLVLPGLIDLHNHLAYNTLPLWTEPSQTTPFAHHNSWTRAATYAASTTWPAYALITACPQELLAYVEAEAPLWAAPHQSRDHRPRIDHAMAGSSATSKTRPSARTTPT